MSRKLLLTLLVSVVAHLGVITYFSQQERKPISMSMGSVRAPLSLTFATVSNPVPTTKKQKKTEPVQEPESVKEKQPKKPLSKPILKKPQPKPEKKQPPKKKVVKKQEKQKEKKQEKDLSKQIKMVESALKESNVEGLSSEPVETTVANAIKQVLPVYPKRYRRRNIEGNVLIKLLVNEKGFVEKVDIVESSGFRQMDQAAITAARQWIFKPEQKDSQRVKSWLKLPVKFQVNRA